MFKVDIKVELWTIYGKEDVPKKESCQVVFIEHHARGIWSLYKASTREEVGAWTNGINVLGTYLHSLFRNNPKLMENYFLPSDSM